VRRTVSLISPARASTARLLQQGKTGFGRLDPARQPAQQQRIQLRLQRTDQPGQRRLRHPQPFGGPCDVSFLGDGDKRTQATQLDHAIP